MSRSDCSGSSCGGGWAAAGLGTGATGGSAAETGSAAVAASARRTNRQAAAMREPSGCHRTNRGIVRFGWLGWSAVGTVAGRAHAEHPGRLHGGLLLVLPLGRIDQDGGPGGIDGGELLPRLPRPVRRVVQREELADADQIATLRLDEVPVGFVLREFVADLLDVRGLAA